MKGFRVANDAPRRLPAFRQNRGPSTGIVRIAGQNMDHPLAKHFLAPILRALAEGPGQRSSRNLQPHT